MEWIRESEAFVNNSYKFHEDFIVHEINETAEMVESFFCGKSPKDTVFRELKHMVSHYQAVTVLITLQQKERIHILM